MVGPIKPQDLVNEKIKSFPEAVFEAFNELIAQNFLGDSATILQSDIVDLMVKKGLDRAEIFKKGWLDVEDAYRAIGWQVEYDKPGFNESYEANFTFRIKKNRKN